MRHRQEQFPDSWCHYRIDAATCDKAADQLMEFANRFGFELPRNAIRNLPLETHDVLAVEWNRKASAGIIMDFPIEKRERDGDPVEVRWHAYEKLGLHLHEQRWMQERRDEMSMVDVVGAEMHYDCTHIGKWACVFADRYPEITVSHNRVPDAEWGTEMKIRTTLEAEAGRLVVEDDTIRLPFRIPDTVLSSMPGKYVREVLTLPTCGDPDLDGKAGGHMIYKTGTLPFTGNAVLKLHATPNVPLNDHAKDAIWRRLRAHRLEFRLVAPDYKGFDVDAEALRYHEHCDHILDRHGLIPYPRGIEGQEKEAA